MIAGPTRRFAGLHILCWAVGCSRPLPEMNRSAISDRVALFATMRDAVNAGDPARYASLYAPDAQITVAGGATLDGRAAIERYERDLLQQYPSTRFEISDIVITRAATIVRYGVNTPAGSGPATGHEGILFYRFDDDGLIRQERRYLDALTPAVQAGAIRGLPSRPPPVLPRPGQLPTPSLAAADRADSIEGETRRVAARFVESTNAVDSPDVGQLLEPAAELDDFSRPAVLRGPAIREWFDQWRSAFPDLRQRTLTTTVAGHRFFLELVGRGTFVNELAGIAPTRESVTIHSAVIGQVAFGRIMRLDVFVNRAELVGRE